MRIWCIAIATLMISSFGVRAEMKVAAVELKSAGPLAFSPNGVLFVGDPQAAAVIAIDASDESKGTAGPVKLAGLDEKIAALLGAKSADISIADVAVHPVSGAVYLSVARGRGPSANAVILKLNAAGAVVEQPLKNVKSDRVELSNPSSGQARAESITGLGFVDGKVVVAGLSSEEFASTLRMIPFPFAAENRGAGIQIYHGAHGKLETQAPIRTFTTMDIAGKTHLLAAYTCTPLVRIPVSQLKAGEKVKGVTVAELGNRNRPLDMVVYNKEGKDYLLMANSARGVMKIDLEKAGTIDAISAPVKGGGTAGLPFSTIEKLKNVMQMAKLDASHALILVKAANGSLDLDTIELP